SNAFLLLVATQPLPSWLDVDLGTVGQTGSASFSNGTFTVKGSGAGVTGATDGVNFLLQTLSGDGTIVARILSVQGATSPQAGVMIRETLNPNATNAYMCNCTYMYFYCRATTGGTETTQGTSGSGLPYWVKLVRAGNVFTAYVSADGLL